MARLVARLAGTMVVAQAAVAARVVVAVAGSKAGAEEGEWAGRAAATAVEDLVEVAALLAGERVQYPASATVVSNPELHPLRCSSRFHHTSGSCRDESPVGSQRRLDGEKQTVARRTGSGSDSAAAAAGRTTAG